ncbi:MAG: ferrochelatase [Candidatus Palauibacterales bacterium]|nr:ferrochelatase [Candidatus Palauibacterales bacterium]MDP2528979.1 ferrochelatase [Candidatus Palauibacterales bacterium]MDP2583797.1 ferrochelatase [Candidatus Palauibacterales bacterium]
MRIGVLMLNFGEPSKADEQEVLPYLERIFLANASLEADEREVRRRSRELAERRTPGLIAEYRAIGGSPLGAQAEAQAEALGEELRRRGHDAVALVGMQFTSPSIADAVQQAMAAGADRLVGLPVYPLCGRSTTIAALESLAAAAARLGWDGPRLEITGWHRHPDYLALRAEAIGRCARSAGIDLADPSVRLVFSAHGTPLRYLDDGTRYDLYVRDYCRAVARLAGAGDWRLGFQNHGNRSIPWTEPEIDQVVRGVEADAVVVDAPSFMHEQSETLSELDIELRGVAETAGLAFHRVPVPHGDPRFPSLLADLVEAVVADRELPEELEAPRLRACRCRGADGARCLNADLERDAAA